MLLKIDILNRNNLLCFSLLAILSISCNSKRTQANSIKQFGYSIADNEFGYLNHINSVDELVPLLDNSNDLEDEYIGFTGERSASYPIFKRLCFIAADTSLLRLSYHPNPKLRIYSMWALTGNNKDLALKRLTDLKNDKSSVKYKSGCITMPSSVAYLTASRFDSTEVEIKSISRLGYLDWDIAIK